MRPACIAGIADVADNFAFCYTCPFFGSYSLEVRVRRPISVLMVNDNRVSEIPAVTCKDNLSAAGCKNRIPFAGRNIDTQVLVFVREFLADDADCRNDVWNAFQPDFFVGREPVVDSFEIDIVFAGRHVRKAVAFDDAVDFIGIVF